MHIFSELWKLSAKDLLALTVLGAAVTTIGNLVATILKEYFFVRSAENWKARRELRAAYKKYRDPLVLSVVELLNRLEEILYSSPVHFLDRKLLTVSPSQPLGNDANDPYYQKYKLMSTVYRLCACLGWLELYRRDVTFLDSGHYGTNRKFERIVQQLRSSLADGHLNSADDWPEWKDSLIFREEQRAIGEAMIDNADEKVVGYGVFCEKFLPTSPASRDPWISVAARFLMDLECSQTAQKDFRRARCMLFVNYGISLIDCLDSRRVSNRLQHLRALVQKDLPKFPLSKAELHSKPSAFAATT